MSDKNNVVETIDFTEAEAALMLSTMVAFADDDPSEAEGVVLRKYYRHETAESAQKKLEDAGYLYPNDLASLKPTIIEQLKKADPTFQLRTVAAALEMARADGTIDQEEIALLSEAAAAMGVSLAEARAYAKAGLREIDETIQYHKNPEPPVEYPPVDLSVAEATVLLSSIVAFADDDPSDEEAAVLREHFGEPVVERALNKITTAGYRYPDDLLQLKPSIFAALDQFNRPNQLRALAIAYRTAIADGSVERSEVEVIREFCERYLIGMGEVKQYFKATPTLV